MNIDHCILGSGALQERFCSTTEILGLMVSHAPRAVTTAQMEAHTGLSAREVGKLCNALSRAALLQPHAVQRGSWSLSCDPCSITLEDVYRCVTAAAPGKSKGAEPPQAGRVHSDVQLLVAQAMMTVNQSVLKHLRQFSLDRLKTIPSAVPQPDFPRQYRSRYDDSPIPCPG